MALHQQQQKSQGRSEAGPSEGHSTKGHREQGGSSLSSPSSTQEGSEQAALLSAVGACKEVVGRLEALLVQDSDNGAKREGCQGYREKCHSLIMQMML